MPHSPEDLWKRSAENALRHSLPRDSRKHLSSGRRVRWVRQRRNSLNPADSFKAFFTPREIVNQSGAHRIVAVPSDEASEHALIVREGYHTFPFDVRPENFEANAEGKRFKFKDHCLSLAISVMEQLVDMFGLHLMPKPRQTGASRTEHQTA